MKQSCNSGGAGLEQMQSLGEAVAETQTSSCGTVLEQCRNHGEAVVEKRSFSEKQLQKIIAFESRFNMNPKNSSGKNRFLKIAAKTE